MKNKKQKPKKINFSICETEENLNKYKKASLNLSGGNLSVYYSLAAKSYYDDLTQPESEKNAKVEVKDA